MTTPQSRVPAIRTTGLDVVLGGVPVVRQVSLEIAAGEAVAVLGNNGSGKTTLVRAMLGLAPYQGEVELFGTPLRQFRDWARIGYVPQRSGILVQQATAREVVASGRLGRRRPFWPETAADRAAVAAALDAVAISDRAGQRFTTMSGGQQQRVLIARALAGGGDRMVWDEPLAGVDHVTQDLLAEVAGELKRQGATIVMVLHEIGPFASILDRAVMIRNGRIMPHTPDPTHRHGGHELADLALSPDPVTGREAV